MTLCMDPFAGSGTLGVVAAKLGRRFLLMDESPDGGRGGNAPMFGSVTLS